MIVLNRVFNSYHVFIRATESRTESQNRTSETEYLFGQNYRNLSFSNRKLRINKLNSNQWIANCHFMHQSRCLHVKGSRKSTVDACYWVRTGQPIMKLPFTIYSKDAVFSLDNDHVTFS